MPTHQLVNSVLSDSRLISPNKIYFLKEIYEIVEKHAGLTRKDYELEENGGIKWKHSIRSILGKRATAIGGRTITYYGKRQYSFR